MYYVTMFVSLFHGQMAVVTEFQNNLPNQERPIAGYKMPYTPGN